MLKYGWCDTEAMASGREKRVMIACVTFETAKVTEPALYYEAERVHLIHYVRDKDKNSVYTDFYDRVCEILIEKRPGIEIVEHNSKVTNFSEMLKEVLNIIMSEDKDSKIFVNISAGSPEYAAAAAIASMMSPGTVPFSVGTQEYTVSDDKIREIYYENDRPVGLTKSTYEPRSLPVYKIERPKKHLVKGLRILKNRLDSKQPTSAKYMIRALKDEGVWFREVTSKDVSKTGQTEAVYYHRDFVKPWQDLNWVTNDEIFKNRLELTEEGERMISTFYL